MSGCFRQLCLSISFLWTGCPCFCFCGNGRSMFSISNIENTLPGDWENPYTLGRKSLSTPSRKIEKHVQRNKKTYKNQNSESYQNVWGHFYIISIVCLLYQELEFGTGFQFMLDPDFRFLFTTRS